MIVGLRMSGRVEVPVEMPLADVAGLIALLLEQLGDGDLAGSQMNLVAGGDPSPHAVAVGGPAGQDRRARRRTDPARRVALGESHALRRELVEIGRLNEPMPVAA